MKFVIYCHKNASESGHLLDTILEKNFAGFDRRIFQTFNGLKERFKQVSDYKENEIFILLADSRNRLTELTALIDLMEGKCLILILPDGSRSTLSRAYGLFPRFCTTISDNYDDLCGVLNKMIAKEQVS